MLKQQKKFFLIWKFLLFFTLRALAQDKSCLFYQGIMICGQNNKSKTPASGCNATIAIYNRDSALIKSIDSKIPGSFDYSFPLDRSEIYRVEINSKHFFRKSFIIDTRNFPKIRGNLYIDTLKSGWVMDFLDTTKEYILNQVPLVYYEYYPETKKFESNIFYDNVVLTAYKSHYEIKQFYEKVANKQIEIQKLNHDKKLDALEKRKQNIIIYITIAVLLVVLAFTVFIFRSLKITRRQKLIIEEKNQEVEEKNKDILAGIRYAKRIQTSLLPTEKYIGRVLNKVNKSTGA